MPKPLGHNTIGDLMPTISNKAALSKRYTNHCLRATAITILDDGNFASRHNMTVTGHKAESSLKSYSRHTSEEIKKSMSHTLSSSLGLGKDQNDNTEVISAVQIHEGEVSGQSEAVQAVCTPTPGSHVDLAVPVVTLDIDDFVGNLPDHVLADIPMPQPPQRTVYNFQTAPNISNCSVVINYNFNR